MVVGLTGGIGTGKTTVLKMFKNLGAITYIADIEAKKLMTTNADLKYSIIKLLGNNAYLKNTLNKPYIASVIFTDKNKLKALNSLVHPKVKEHFFGFKKQYPNKIIIYESAILFESNMKNNCDYSITVTADFEERIKRVTLRDKVEREKIEQRIKNQSSEEEKKMQATFIIKNTNLQATQQQVNTVYNLLKRLVKV